MTEPARKPDICELVGMAFSASSLRLREGVETPLERIAALGAAQLAVQNGAARADLPIGAMEVELQRRSQDMRQLMAKPAGNDERDVLAAELSGCLWHLRYGDQYELVPRTAVLFGAWLAQRRRFAGQPPALLSKFATRALHEWLSSRCPKCAGSKWEEKTLAGNWVRPRGAMQRNAILRTCRVCDGSGRSLPCHPERMKLLGMTRKEYDDGAWGPNFTAAIAWLSNLLSKLIHRPLTAELERRKRRP